MKTMRIMAFVLTLLMLGTMPFVLASCTGGSDTPVTDPTSEPTSQPTVEPTVEPTAEPTAEPNAPTKLTVKELLNQMQNTVYTSNITSDAKIGLTDSTAVGIREETFTTEVRYPVPDDSEFGNRIYRVEDYGLSTEADTNSTAFRDLLTTLKSVEGKKKVVFQPGVYKFNTTISIKDIDDLYICCADSTKYFEIRFTQWVQGFSVENCDNFHLNNYEMDYETPSTVAGSVVSTDKSKKSVTLRIDDEFDLNQACYYYGKKFGGSYSEVIQFKTDETTGKLIPDPNGKICCGSGEIQTNTAYDTEKKELTITFVGNIGDIPEGTRFCVTYTMYEYFGFYASNCGKIYVEDAKVYHTCGMAYGMGDCEGVYFNRVRLDLREGSGRLMTATADGFHTCDVSEIVVSNCTFRYSHDDSFNIKNTYYTVKGVVNKKVSISATSAKTFEVGDEVAIYESECFARIGTYQITKVEYKTGGIVDLTLNQAVPEEANNWLLADNTRATKFTLENCLIGNKRNRGILLQTRESVIRNNTFTNIVHGAVLIYTIRDQFAEGICPANVTVENNKFINNYHPDINIFTYGSKGPYSGTTAGLLEGIVVQNNVSIDCGKTSFGVYGLGVRSAIRNNLVYNCCKYVTSNSSKVGMSFSYCDSTEITNNIFYGDSRLSAAITKGDKMTNITEAGNKFTLLK